LIEPPFDRRNTDGTTTWVSGVMVPASIMAAALIALNVDPGS
jgi:hypothetical protein